MSDIIRTLFPSRSLERRFGESSAIPSNAAGWTSWAGVPVTQVTALQQATVWACVALRAESVAMLPVGAFRGEGDTRQQIELPPLLERPHADLEWNEWIGQMVVSRDLRGNSYGLIIERDRLGYATQIEPLSPDAVKVTNVNGALRYKVSGLDGFVSPFDMFHVRGLMLPGSRVGLSPIEYARQTFGLAIAAQEFGARLFGDGGFPSGLLTTEAVIDKDMAEEMQDRWLSSHGARSRKPAVLGGGLKWETVSMSPNEAQFLETRKFSRSEICGFYRTPPHMVGDVERSTSWGTGIEEQGLMFVTYTLGSIISSFEEALEHLLPPGDYMRFNVSALLRGRTLDRFDAYLKARQGGWYSVDDVRRLEDMAPLSDGRGDDYLQPLNFAPIPSGGATEEMPMDDEDSQP